MAYTIDVFADIVCPWCWVGERHLAQALERWTEEFPDEAVPVLRFLPFELNPDMPAEGMDRTEYLDRKFGAGGASEMHVRLEAAGSEAGIDFRFADIARMPNTRDAHVLLQALVGEPERQYALFEALARAFFSEGEDISSRVALIEVAKRVGLPAEQSATWLADPALRSRTTAIELQAREIGVQGVPFFIFNRRLAVNGAQPPDVLFDAMQEARS